MKGLALAAAFLLALAACGGGQKVGEAFEEFEGGEAGERLGGLERTPTPEPRDDNGGGQQQQQTTPPPQQTPPPPQAVDVQITNQGFNPTALRVTLGATIKVTNVDSQPHSYTAVAGNSVVYDTGSLAGGQSKTFSADKAGQYQIEDRSRNWILGSLEVVAR